jgi:hypothetical protein
MTEQTIVCPKCGKHIPISKALSQQIESELRATFEAEASEREKEAHARFEKMLIAESVRVEKRVRREAEQAQSARISSIRKQLEEAQKRERESRADFEQRLSIEKSHIEKQAQRNAEKKLNADIVDLQSQLREKGRQAAEVQKQAEEVRRLQDQLRARQKGIEDEVASKVKKELRSAEQAAAERIEEEYRSRELELEKKLSDAKQQAADLKRKLEQSSQQTQGEVLELKLEQILRKHFPDDEIEPIAKGKPGADVLHRVYLPGRKYCGSIVWESKNSRSWSNGWLGKLRNDQRRVKADLAVLISLTLPKGVTRFAQVDGIWVTELSLVIGLATALRNNLIQVSTLKRSSEGKHEKMELLYQYLSSTEFRHRIEGIVEAFGSMQDDLAKERETMQKHWAKREKQIELVVQNVSGMYGDMQGIAGQSLPKIRRLELPS